MKDGTFTFKSAALEQLPDVQDGIDQLVCALPQGIKLLQAMLVLPQEGCIQVTHKHQSLQYHSRLLEEPSLLLKQTSTAAAKGITTLTSMLPQANYTALLSSRQGMDPQHSWHNT